MRTEPRTSTGLRKVMVMFIGPACMTKMDRVGVIWMLVTFAFPETPDASFPIHWYVVPSTLILPAQPMIAFTPPA